MPQFPLQTRQVSYLKLFSNLNHIVNRTTDIVQLARSAVELIQSVLEAENCSIMFLNAEGTALTMLVSSVLSEDICSHISIPLGHGVAGKVVQTGQPILRLRRFGHPVEKAEAASSGDVSHPRYRTDSFISVPLRVEETNTVIGVLNVTDRLNQEDLTQADLDMLLAIGGLIASAIENHRTWTRANEAREQLSEMVNGLPLGMFAISRGGLLTLCNRAARQYLNLGNGEGINFPWRRFFPQQAIGHIENALEELDNGRPSSVEFEIEDQSSGKQRAVRLSALQIEELAPVNAIFIIEDLRQMQELYELRRSDQMKSTFLSLISHELRTPLAAIKGAVHLLNQVAPPAMRESMQSIFAILYRNSNRLSRVVNNILDAMDIESGALRLYRKRIDMHAILIRIVDRYKGSEDNRGVEWKVSLQATQPMIYADEGRMSEVIEHLLENAAKFVSENGTISVTTASKRDQWVLKVSNTGREIDPALKERIFTKFYQVDASLTRQIGGSGVGLFLCREIVRLHQGDVCMDTDFTGGVCMTVSLPESEQGA
ncbi:MAG TPA: ATP-binding protein [Candidatus Sumerlaeota bacterium]|nr:ATP-binding protein [Candidatus Sumerlaeota bacterium]HPS01454.1 ATP-binding protein [Candidatus Sumerlaeota bacterium]